MEYKNDKVYSGVYGGIPVTFSIHGFSEKVVDEFNRRLADEAKARQLSLEAIRPVSDKAVVSAD